MQQAIKKKLKLTITPVTNTINMLNLLKKVYRAKPQRFSHWDHKAIVVTNQTEDPLIKNMFKVKDPLIYFSKLVKKKPILPAIVFILRQFYKKHSIKRSRFVVTKQSILIKGKYGSLVHVFTESTTKTIEGFKKYIFAVTKKCKEMSSLWTNSAGVVGRGMFGYRITRSLFLGKQATVLKKGRKNSRSFDRALKVLQKKRVKSQNKKIKKTKRKKKVYTSLVRRNNKWHRSKHVLTRWLSQVGERGHVFFPQPRKFAVKFKRKNTLYKVLTFASTWYDAHISSFTTTTFIKMRSFGPYKVKGLKRLGHKGVIKEGKARKF